MQKARASYAFKIIRRYLPRHIHRNITFKSEHHFRKRTVNVVYHIQMKSFFKEHRHAEHPFFCKVFILCHFFHRHIAEHRHILHGRRNDRCFQKVEIRIFHSAQSAVNLCCGKTERNGGDFQFIEMYDLYVFIQIKLIQSRKKTGYFTDMNPLIRNKPFTNFFASCGEVRYIRNGAGQQRRKRRQFFRRRIFTGNKSRYIGNKRFGIGRTA